MPRKGLPRAFDFISSLLALVPLAPLFAVIAVLIKVSSHGPVFFRQKRVGRGNRDFDLMKFRTMRADSVGLKITGKGDPRITGVGRFLRKTKLDELPQLINVLRGEMAVVGPRPEVREYMELNPKEWRKILEARPGVTDPVTLKLRNEEDLLAEVDSPGDFYARCLAPYKIGGYLEYIENRSAAGDLAIIAKTILGIIFPGLTPAPGLEEIRKGWNDGKTAR